MIVSLVNPTNNLPLSFNGENHLVDSLGNNFPIVDGVARFVQSTNYAQNFGWQWNKFDKTQLDRVGDGQSLSKQRLFAETGWEPSNLFEKCVLEVGSGAGRFSKVLLEYTKVQLYSIDYSDAVNANFLNNGKIAPERFHLFQASIYEMPFKDGSFDKVLCLGVLQHTPNFSLSVQALVSKAKIGGEIVVDFYPIKGWWTKIHAKYIFRPLTKRLNNKRLFNVIDANADWLIKVSKFLDAVGLGLLNRFIPIVDLRTLPFDSLTKTEFREWVVLDTFDMFSPEYDYPQRIEDVVEMFHNYGAKVTFSDFVEYTHGYKAAVVRGIKLK